MALILCVCVLRGRKSGLIPEAFNLLGVIFATFISLHYYVRASVHLKDVFSLSELLSHVVSYIVLAVFIMCVFAIIRKGWLLILKIR